MESVLFKSMFINISYKYYSIMDKNFIMELRFLYVKILLKSIAGFIKENTKEPWVEIIKIIKHFIGI